MRISLEWLKDYVALHEAPEQLKAELTMAGLVVDSVDLSGPDAVLEMEITSNRPDCLNHIGVARELGALYRRDLTLPPRKKNLRSRRERIPYSVEILDADLCPRYCGLVMDGIRVAPSPAWMKRRLMAAGMRPVNNIVDITNYVLLEMGHPLHAFDFRRLRGARVVVARAADGQKMITLDGIERALDSGMLLINDGEGPVAIAGVMGGLESEIVPGTDTVLLECAYFHPSSIRRTAKRLGLSTEASYRFERGVDWDGTVAAIARTCGLIEELAGGRIAGSLQDCYPKPVAPVQIELSRERAERLMGVKLEDQFVEATLGRLHFKLKRRRKGVWTVVCPSYRADMEFEADLIEEIARFYGYQNIPTTVPPAWSAGMASPIQPYEAEARRILLGLGYTEAVNLSFAPEVEHHEFAPLVGERVAIRNPLTEETGYMRSTLVAGLLRAARGNVNHDVHEVRLFEIAKVYHQGPQGRPVEKRALGILGLGSHVGQNWAMPSAQFNFYHLKGVVEAFLTAMRCSSYRIRAGTPISWLNPSDACILEVNGKTAGVFGSLHPRLEEEQKLRRPVYLAEIDFEGLFSQCFQPVRYQALPRYPAVERDISVLLPRGTLYSSVREGIAGLAIAEMTGLELIDVYEGEKIPAGKLSMTVRITFLDRERTLTIERVQGFSDIILHHLRAAHGAELR